MDAPQTNFLIHIMDGYSFRNAIGIIKNEIDRATMVLSPRKIEISFVNSSKCAIHKIDIQTPELTMYRYNIRDDDGNLFPEYPIAFETNEMFNTTKGIGRRDGIRIYWLAGENRLNVQPMKSNTKDPGRASALFIPILNLEYVRYEISNSYNEQPNVRVQAKEFADVCSQANTLKCTSLRISGRTNGVTFDSVLPNKSFASTNRFRSQIEMQETLDVATNLDEVDHLIQNIQVPTAESSAGLSLNVLSKEDLMTVEIPISPTVKALSKIHNISPAGTKLRFWFAVGKPTKIESPIGTYGTYTICLRNAR